MIAVESLIRLLRFVGSDAVGYPIKLLVRKASMGVIIKHAGCCRVITSVSIERMVE